MLFAKETLDNLEKNGTGKKIPFGIHLNNSVTSVEVGERWLDFNYESVDGSTHNKRVWFPELGKVLVNDGETQQDALKRADEQAFSHLVKHMRIFLSPEELNLFSAPDIRTAATNCAAILAPRLKNKKVNLKLIYDKEGQWSVFGNFPDYIEEYIEDVPTKLKFTDWELKNRCTPKAAEVEQKDETRLY